MSVRDRLNRLTGEETKKPEANPRNETISELRKRVEALMARRERISQAGSSQPRDSAVPLEHVVTGEEVEMPQGRFFFSRSIFKAEDFHGHFRVCDLSCISMRAAGILASSSDLARSTPADALFLDTETTGLAGGTGTFPFLIGLGWFEQGSFVTCQLFARDFSEECAMLAFLCEAAAERRFLVTFNGKAFDVGLLAARFILNRLRDPLSTMPHLDLLHPSRRLLGHRLENTRLVTLEEAVLGVQREGDIPGQEIPQRYFDWLKRRDGRALGDVFKHNRFDIVSMASLTKHLTDLLEDRHDSSHAHHADLLSAARLLHERGHTGLAKPMFERLVNFSGPDIELSAKRLLSLILKKSGQWSRAVALWEEMIFCDPYDVFAVEELAKWYEHHVHEFGRAAEMVSGILERTEALTEMERQAFAYRLERLLHKASTTQR
jgi:uncharacterized protein